MRERRKFIKYGVRTLAVVSVLAVLVILSPFSLKKTGSRNAKCVLNSELRSEIRDETRKMSSAEICSYSVKKTSKELSFAMNNDLRNGRANCVGYAQMCSSIANYAFQKNGYRCKARPVVGYVTLFGINICEVLKCVMPSKRLESFVKDHDFVEFSTDNETFYADASMYDILYNDCKTVIP